ncbi:SLAP domain-containing protein [Lactobacillus sp. ESL0791]|uniref:SLAP domain-containing protein n=1 Tax=Lactobacillus sp. ESL0791 TaxID=2983234 RepID=UPI0023F6897A|nr:SLAP domain-containing protein [Lactobacillus sp. ESL0791]MDF7638660.1 SLAP domain-containing protein [Lactobacillus sp. ESL0791]
MKNSSKKISNLLVSTAALGAVLGGVALANNNVDAATKTPKTQVTKPAKKTAAKTGTKTTAKTDKKAAKTSKTGKKATKTAKKATKKAAKLAKKTYVFDAKGKQGKKALAKGASVQILGHKVVNGKKFYVIGKNEFIPASSVVTAKKTASKKTVVLAKKAVIYDAEGKPGKTALKKGATVKVLAVKTINGKKFYQVKKGQYILAADAEAAKKPTKPTTPSEASNGSSAASNGSSSDSTPSSAASNGSSSASTPSSAASNGSSSASNGSSSASTPSSAASDGSSSGEPTTPSSAASNGSSSASTPA